MVFAASLSRSSTAMRKELSSTNQILFWKYVFPATIMTGAVVAALYVWLYTTHVVPQTRFWVTLIAFTGFVGYASFVKARRLADVAIEDGMLQIDDDTHSESISIMDMENIVLESYIVVPAIRMTFKQSARAGQDVIFIPSFTLEDMEGAESFQSIRSELTIARQQIEDAAGSPAAPPGGRLGM